MFLKIHHFSLPVPICVPLGSNLATVSLNSSAVVLHSPHMLMHISLEQSLGWVYLLVRTISTNSLCWGVSMILRFIQISKKSICVLTPQFCYVKGWLLLFLNQMLAITHWLPKYIFSSATPTVFCDPSAYCPRICSQPDWFELIWPLKSPRMSSNSSSPAYSLASAVSG